MGFAPTSLRQVSPPPVFEMTNTVSSGTLDSSSLYHTVSRAPCFTWPL